VDRSNSRIRWTRLFIGGLLTALTSFNLLADVVVLKNGNEFEGKVVEETPERVVLQMPYGTMEFPRSQIQEIKKKEGYVVPKPPPAPKETPKPEGPAKTEEPAPAAPATAPKKPAPGSPGPVDLSTVPQSPRVTLEASERSPEEVLYKISRQSNHKIEWNESGEEKRLTLSLQNAFFWEAIMTVCEQGGWGFSMYAQPGNPIGIPGSFNAPPPRGYQVAGPLLLVWHGLNEESTFDFSTKPAKSVKVTQLALNLMVDPKSSARIMEPVLNPDFTFTLQGGRQVTVKSDREMQDGMGGRAWRFRPGGQLSGDTADLSVTIPVWAPARSREARLPWRKQATAKVGDVNVTLADIVKEGTTNLRVSLTLGYDEAVLKEFTSDEAMGARVISVTGIAVTGKNGTRIEGHLGSGGGSPMGYTWSGTLEPEAGSEPAEFIATWTEGYARVDVPFRLKGIPLSAKATAEYKPPARQTAPAPPGPPPTPARRYGVPIEVAVKRTPRPGPNFGMVERGTIKGKESPSREIRSLSFSPDGSLLAVVGIREKGVPIWSVSDLQREKTALFGVPENCTVVAFCPDGRLCAGGWGGVVKVFDVEGERDLATLKSGDFSVVSLAISPDGKRLAVGYFGDTFTLWDMDTRELIAKLDDAAEVSACFSPDGRIGASISTEADAGVRIWDATSAKRLKTISPGERSFSRVCFSPDGKLLAVATGPQVKLYDTTDWQEMAALQDSPDGEPRETAVTSIAFSPDGAVLASGSRRKTVKLWDVGTHEQLAVLEGHAGPINVVTFSPDGELLASGDTEGTIKLWQWKR